MRNIILAALGCLLLTKAMAQNEVKPFFERGRSYISVGHGIGNIWKSYLKEVINLPGVSYKVRSLGPYTFIYEYGFSKRISGGVAVAYSEINGTYTGYGENYKDRLTIFSILARANYHFFQKGKWNLYAGGGAGYVNSQYDNSDSQSGRSAPPEFGYSGQLGVQYLLKSRLGLYTEIGYVGGSFIQIGASVKL